LEEDCILNGYSCLAAAGVDQKDMEREMNKFLKQVEPDDVISAPPTPKTVESNEFEVVISSDEEEDNENDSDSDDWIVDEDIA
jgi:hypothetical protein